MNQSQSPEDIRDSDIAMIGMSCRFPNAGTPDQFWENLKNGVEAVRTFSDDELMAAGSDLSELSNPNYVKADTVLENVDRFDATFFNYTPREAALLDPQQRFFLECAWEALENAGYAPSTYPGWVGLYGGVSPNSYLLLNLYTNPDLIKSVGAFQLLIGNDKDTLCTRVSYKLNLRGPSITVQTACSTSLVAVHLACQSLLNGECDMAMAGGSSIVLPQGTGYLYQEGMIFSPDGHCRSFDAQGQGTVGGRGVAIVVLKRLSDAIADGDQIYAVIKGSAINNDGAAKVGFTAPSVAGQAAVISEALTMADVHPESISYIEAHGTATPMGDPIEITALTQAYREKTDRVNYCAIGSVKSNIGHTDVTAGVAGLIKTALALKHRQIPPSLHFKTPNPKINFAASPFYVNTSLTEWKSNGAPRRAGVSSLGIGGTNAHVILEEAPQTEPSSEPRPWQLLTISAKTPTALDAATQNLLEHLRHNPALNLADVAYTLLLGRESFEHRRMLICRNVPDAIAALNDPARIHTDSHEPAERPITLMFPGYLSLFPNVGVELYQSEPVFKKTIDHCAEMLLPTLGFDLRDALYPQPDQQEFAVKKLKEIWLGQPAIFVLEYALAQQWLAWGLEAESFIGHSLGEYVAACLAGVFSLEDALKLIAVRGKLLDQMPEKGEMMLVPLPEEQISPMLSAGLSIGAHNGPVNCVVSGPLKALEQLRLELAAQGIECHPLNVNYALHSPLIDSIIEPFVAEVAKLGLNPPQTPYISGLTGKWITADEATNPAYYGMHLRQTVRFVEGLELLWAEPSRIFLELGPSRILGALANQYAQHAGKRTILVSLPNPRENQPADKFLLNTIGQLWLHGVSLTWAKLYTDQRRQRLPLPTYPFERQRHWIEPGAGLAQFLGQSPAPRVDEKVSATVESQSVQHSDSGSLTPLESQLLSIWQNALGIHEIGIHDDFFALGGHSLLASQLVFQMRSVLNVDFSLNKLFEAPTIAQMAQVVEHIQAHGVNNDDEHQKWLTACVTDTILNPDIRFDTPFTFVAEPKTLFLTGATGFLGSQLLGELLQKTQAQIYCLIRANRLDEGHARVVQKLKESRLWQDVYAPRILPVLGDLSYPTLGIQPAEFDYLARTVDVIYHCGAWVNFTYPYSALKSANVNSVEEIIRFAVQGKMKPIQYISTLAVLYPFPDVDVVLEDEPLENGSGMTQGYAQSKWVSEKLLLQARAKGLPVSIHRPGIIGGHSQTGVNNTKDFVWALLKGCIQLGFAPDVDETLMLTPVDAITQSIVHAAGKAEWLNRNFHYLPKETIAWQNVVRWLRAYGYTFEMVPFRQWIDILFSRAEKEQNALLPFLPLFTDVSILEEYQDAQQPPPSPRLDCQNFDIVLAALAKSNPTMGQDLLETYLTYLAEIDYLPKPVAVSKG